MTLQVACEQFTSADDISCDCDEVQTAVLNEMIDQASDALAILSYGAVEGQCTETVRPRGPGGCTCSCAHVVTCGCCAVTGVTLRGPNPTVTTILIDGVEFTDFKIIDGRTLIRTDNANWPGCQDLALDDDAVGAFTVTYTYGLEVPRLAKDAAEEIVCSFIKKPPQEQRRLPQNTRQLSFSGVSITLEQQMEELKRRTFMMPFVIRFLTIYAPDPVPAVVYSPELEDSWQLHRAT